MEPLAGIDHVIIGVRDLETARSNWSRLGFTLSPRGRHLNQPTGNYCIMFPTDYIELLGIVDNDGSSHRLDNFLSRREGPMGAALAPVGSAEEARAVLVERGLHPSLPRTLERRIELAEGTALLRFSLVSLLAEETPGLDSFLCGHLTPELMRRDEWLDHPNGATGIDGVHILVESTAPLLPAYDRLFGIVQVTTTDAVAAIHIGRHRLVFSTPDDFQTMHPGFALDRDFRLPGIVALEIGVEQRERTAGFLRGRQIVFSEMPDGGLAIAQHEANGAMLFFRET